MDFPLTGYGVKLASVVELIVREQRLHQVNMPTISLIIKIDGKPFWGNNTMNCDFLLLSAIFIYNIDFK